MVAPTERRVRSISMGDQGKPSLRMAPSSRVPARAACYIVGIVDPCYLLAARGGGLCQRIAQCCQVLVERLVLWPGKAVALGQRQGGVVG